MKMESQIVLVDIEDIIPNRFQPRLKFDEEALNELSESIKQHGIIQPLVLRRVGTKFEIIAGERRYKASILAGLAKVPAIIANLDDNESAEVAVIENTHRRDLSPIEEAKSYKKLLDRKYLSQEQLAKRLGKSQSAIANKIRLLNLDEKVQDAINDELISERHARSLLKLTDKQKQIELLSKIIEERWTVKRLDEEIDKVLNMYRNNVEDLVGNINLSNLDIDVENIKNKSTDITPEPNIGKFNSLDNAQVNMNFSFNPFNTDIKPVDIIDDFDSFEEQLEEPKEEIKEQPKKLTTANDVLREINSIIKQAKDNDIPIKTEEFEFDTMHQIIIRLDKEDN